MGTQLEVVKVGITLTPQLIRKVRWHIKREKSHGVRTSISAFFERAAWAELARTPGESKGEVGI